jgi:rubrerythrin
MNTIDLAKNIELEGKAFYEKLAADSPIPALSGIFSLLAKEEQQHYNVFDAWEKENRGSAPAAGTAGAEAKRIFSRLSVPFTLPQVAYDYGRAYGTALDMERKSIALYENMLAESVSADDKKVFSFLISEEQKHEHLVEHLLEFVNEPKEFLENAEFNHL